jgi:hypothetical protein
MKRGLAGEPIWLAVAVGAWLVRRARKAGPDVVWEGRVSPGQRLIVTTSEAGSPPSAGGSATG